MPGPTKRNFTKGKQSVSKLTRYTLGTIADEYRGQLSNITIKTKIRRRSKLAAGFERYAGL